MTQTQQHDHDDQTDHTDSRRDRNARAAMKMFRPGYAELFDGRQAHAIAEAAYRLADAMEEIRLRKPAA